MAGILSIGWYLPEQRASAEQVAADYGLSAQAVRDFGLRSKVVAGPHDHPTTLAARATTAALAAANLTPSQIDLLIFAGTTRDRPAPWIAAFGVLQELGASNAAGFDLSGRCPGLADALWVAATLIQAGGVATVAVCCGDRFDYVMPAVPGEFSLSQAIFSAGGAAAILGTQAGNEIVGRAHHTREDLSSHTTGAPVAGGSLWPLDHRALDERAHTIRDTTTVAQLAELHDYLRHAEKVNIEAVCKTAGFDEIDFITGSVLDAKSQSKWLAALGIGPDKYLMMMPSYGHMGPSSALISIGHAIQEGRPVGPRLVMSLRTYMYSNAIAVRGAATDLGIRVSGPMRP